MAKDRARDDRRTVGSHEKMMSSLGKAAGWSRFKNEGLNFAVRNDADGSPAQEQTMGEHPHSAFIPGTSHTVRYTTKEAAVDALSGIADRPLPGKAPGK